MRFQFLFYLFCKWLIWLSLKIIWRCKVTGHENIPQTGPVIIASNHASYADPPVVGSSIRRSNYFMAKAKLYSVPLLGLTMKNLNTFPVRRGEHDVTAFKTSLRLLGNGEVVVLFPEGRRIRTGNIGPARPGLGMLAAKSRAKVVPAYLHNTDAMLKLRRVAVTFGKPVVWSDDDDYQTFTDNVMERIRELRQRYLSE